MLTARVIQGAGGAIFPLAFSIIRDEFPRERVAGAIGLISALIGVGAGVAIVIAGPIVDNLSIHWLFWIPAAMTAVALVATIFWVPESPIKAPGHIDRRRHHALGLARLPAPRRQRGRRVGVDIGARDRAVRRRGAAVRRLALDRDARASSRSSTCA